MADVNAKNQQVVRPDGKGNFALAGIARTDIVHVDVSDVDIILRTKDGKALVLPEAAVDSMSEHPPHANFSDGSVAVDQLMGEVSTVVDLANVITMPSSVKTEGVNQETDSTQQQQQQQQQQEAKDTHSQTESQVSALTVNTEGSVEQMVQNILKIDENLHTSDYIYEPPVIYAPPPNPVAAPAGVPPPISLTPLVTLFMGNAVDNPTPASTTVNPGYTTYYGGGGQAGSGALDEIGPRNALQYSAATITGDGNNDIIYADGPEVGNNSPAVNNSAVYTKEFVLSVAGYFTTLNPITFSGVPDGVSIVGAVNQGGGVWILASNYVTQQQIFSIQYNTSNYSASGNNTFTIQVDITGNSSHGSQFHSEQSFEFEYMNVTSESMVADPGLVYDDKGVSKEIYVLPTLGQPNIITAGDGNDIIYGGVNNDTITLGNGNNTIYENNGNNVISVGDGNNTISSGNGNNSITTGTGTEIITTGSGNDAITTSGGVATINAGDGNNTIVINSASGSTNLFTLTTTGTGTNNISGGDGIYTISMGAGSNTVNIGNGSVSTATQITTGAGTNNITTGDGEHTISVGVGNATIVTGTGTDSITTAGGGGSLTTAAGAKTITINSTSGSTNTYTLTTIGAASSTILAGDDNYNILLGSGTNHVSLGNGTSTVSAAGAGVDTISVGNGSMTITTGGGTGNSVTTGTGTVNITNGSGSGDTVTTVGGGGTITDGDGAGDTINAGSGNYTITTGNGANDVVVTGSGNSTINVGTGGSDNITVGTGANRLNIGLGTNNTLAAGSTGSTLNFSGITSTALTVSFGVTGTNTASGTGVGDTFTGFTTLYTTNQGDTVTMGTGSLTLFAGTGNDTIHLGTGADIVYAGNGNNSIIGTSLTTNTGDQIFGGTGNNIFSAPNAGSTYNGTNGVALSTIANNLAYTFTNASTAVTTNLYLNTQLNTLDYSAGGTTSMTINLASGQGAGGLAAGSIFAFTPTAGYSTINKVISDNGGSSLTPSYDNTVLIGGYGANSFNDTGTLYTQKNILVGDYTSTTGGTQTFYMGAAQETVVGSAHASNTLFYYNSPTGVVINLDSVSHTFTSALYSYPVTVAAYSGSNWGLNSSVSNLSYSTGDYYEPVNGTSTGINYVQAANQLNLVYGGSNFVTYISAGANDFFYGGSGGSLFYMSYGADVAVASGGLNEFYTFLYNDFVILNKALDTGSQSAKDQAFSTTYGGVTYAGFAYGQGNATTPVAGSVTYLSNYEDIIGSNNNDYFVGDNLGNQFNAQGGNNTIILGDGTNIITALFGTNIITSSSANTLIGTNTLNFESNSDAYSGNISGWSGTATAGVEVMLNYSSSSTQSTFFGTGDATSVFGSVSLATLFQAQTNGYGLPSYSSVQAGIISIINGSDYSGTATNTALGGTFTFDNVYSGAATIIGHAGNDIFLDNIGTATEVFTGTSDKSNLYYMTPTQVSHVTIAGSSTGIDILRVEGWGATTTTGNAFGTDPFTSSTKFTYIDVLDVRSGVDALTANTTTTKVVNGAHTATNASAPTFNLNALDIQDLNTNGTSSSLTLKLDSGDHFTPTVGAGTGALSVLTASTTATDTIYYFYSDAGHTTANTTNRVAVLDVHYGAG